MTDENFQLSVVRGIARIEAKQAEMAGVVKRVEAAVLGTPDQGVDGLLTRMAIVEKATTQVAANTPGKVKRVVINSGAGVTGGVVVLFLMNEVWPVLKGLLVG